MNTNKNTHKITLALNKRISDETGLLKCAIIAALSLGTSASEKQRSSMKFMNYVDANDQDHSYVSALSLVVMRGKSGELKKFYNNATEKGIVCANITHSMISEEMCRSFAIDPISDTQYVAVIAFGEIIDISQTTGRLSLWK